LSSRISFSYTFSRSTKVMGNSKDSDLFCKRWQHLVNTNLAASVWDGSICYRARLSLSLAV